MKTLLSLAAAGLLLSGCIGAGTNTGFDFQSDTQIPAMTGVDLFGEDRSIPGTFDGKLNIVTVAFEQEHQLDVNTWIPIADELMETHENLRFYEIPVIFKANALFRTWVNNGMRSGIPSDKARERTITVYTDREALSEKMQFQMDRIYTFIVDGGGQILWRAEGPVTKEAETELRNFITNNL